jgi:hypothetical protein
MDVGIGGIGLNDIGKLSEITGVHVLGKRPDHTGCGQRAGNAYAGRRARGGACRAVAQIGAQEYRYAAGYVTLSEMNMRLGYWRAQAGIGKLVGRRLSIEISCASRQNGPG